jgi:hypothetical protein
LRAAPVKGVMDPGGLRNREGSPSAVARVALVWLAALAGLALLGAQSADAAWTHFVNVSKQEDVEHPLVEMSPAGDAVFLWMQGFDATGYPALYTRVRKADGSLSPIQRIGTHFGEYDLAVDSDGNAYYVWPDIEGPSTRLQTRVRYADGTLSPVQTVTTAPRGDFIVGRVGVGASGTAVYAWIDVPEDDVGVLEARTRSPSGTFGAVHGIAKGYLLDWVFDADFAVDASGNATFVWDETGDSGGTFTRVLAPSGSLSPVTKVSRLAQSGSDPRVVVTPSGRALFGWDEYHSDSTTHYLLVRSRSADGDFQPPQVVAKHSDRQAGVPSLQLGIAPTGQAVIGWPTNHAWYARPRAPGGALGATKTITTAMVRDSDLGIDSQGNVVFAWTPWTDGKTRVFVRTEDAGGALSPTRALSLAGYNAYFPGVAVSPAGDAAVGWQEGRQGFAIQASFGP